MIVAENLNTTFHTLVKSHKESHTHKPAVTSSRGHNKSLTKSPIRMDIAPSPASASRKRERENETPSQRHKREKAAERQRRKRERDRNNGNNTPLTPAAAAAAPGVLFSIPPNEHQQESPGYAQGNRQGEDSLLSPEELARRDKVRKAARERQRKHRALVKDRRMRELGLDMGNEISEIPYHGGHVQDSHHYSQAVMGHHELGHHPQHVGEGQPQVQGGEMFASTLLLSFSCAPLLKQHLLSTLSMTSEELTSFEPIIAEAWEHWDRQVGFHTINTLSMWHLISFY